MRLTSSPSRLFQASSNSSKAFTLVELLVVIGIIAVLIGILLPTLSRARQTSYDTRCQSNLAQMGLALKLYAHDNKDHFPNPGALGDGENTGTSAYFRRGINEPDPADPTKIETLGLHNLLYRLGYAKSPELWICTPVIQGPSSRNTTRNAYAWFITKKVAAMTSIQRSRVPRNATTDIPEPQNWWIIRDNYETPTFATNTPSNNAVSMLPSTWHNIPHPYRTNTKVARTGRFGAVNVLFYDGAVGRFVYGGANGNTMSILRGE